MTQLFINKQVQGILPIANGGTGESSISGWYALETCTYETADSPTFQLSIASDVTGLLSPGMRIKLTQTTVKYFIVTAVGAYTAGKTIITIYGGTDYTLANAAITLPFYSVHKAPFGFPLASEKWSVLVTNSSTVFQATPTQNTWYNLGSIQISVPIGLWNMQYYVHAFSYANIGQVNSDIYVTLSAANNTESIPKFTSGIYLYGAGSGSGIFLSLSKENEINLSTKTTYFLNAKTINITGVVTSLNFRGDITLTILRCVCGYL